MRYGEQTILVYWTITDIALNITASIGYQLLLEQLQQEQEENRESNSRLQLQDEVNQVVKERTERPRLDLSNDYYAMTFVTYIKYYRQKFNITAEQKSLYMINVMFIFIFQSVLLLAVYYNITEVQVSSEKFTIMVYYDIMIVRIICAFLMHMLSEPEVR